MTAVFITIELIKLKVNSRAQILMIISSFDEIYLEQNKLSSVEQVKKH